MGIEVHCIQEDIDEIQLIPFGDVHLGDRSCNLKRAQQTIDWVAKHENARVVLMGDLLNSATKTSVGAAVFDEETHGQQQYETMVNMLTPIKKKIYGAFIGNHEQRILDSTGYDVTKQMSKELGHKYYGYGAFIKVRVKDHNYIIFGTHGSSMATLPYTKIKKLLDMSSFIEADIYLMGHVHSSQVHTQEVKGVDLKNKTVQRMKKYYILTGHYLNYEGSYAEMKSMRPEKQGSPTIILGSDNKFDVRVIL